MARKRHTQEQQMHDKIKRRVLLAISIPFVILVIFLLFGPYVGKLFGLVSIYRNEDPFTKQQAPTIPIFIDTIESSNSTAINIKGLGQPGSTIKLFVNGPEVQTTVVTTDGLFEFADVQLIVGRNTIFAKAIGENNLESEKSQDLTIVVDKRNPKISIEEPKDDAEIKNLNNRFTIKGKVNEKATITINDRFVVQKPDLSFEYSYGTDKEGEIEIKVVAIDEAGNKTEEEFKVTYLKQSE